MATTRTSPSARASHADPRDWYATHPHPHQHLDQAHSALDLFLWTIRGMVGLLLAAALSHHVLGWEPNGRLPMATGMLLTTAGACIFCGLAMASSWRQSLRRARNIVLHVHKA